MLVVKLFHLIVDVESQVDMVGQDVLPLFNVHILQLRDVLFELIDGLRGILLLDDILDVSALLAEYFLKSIEMLVTHILKGFVFVCQSKYLDRIDLDLMVLLSIRSDNVGVHGY